MAVVELWLHEPRSTTGWGWKRQSLTEYIGLEEAVTMISRWSRGATRPLRSMGTIEHNGILSITFTNGSTPSWVDPDADIYVILYPDIDMATR